MLSGLFSYIRRKRQTRREIRAPGFNTRIPIGGEDVKVASMCSSGEIPPVISMVALAERFCSSPELSIHWQPPPSKDLSSSQSESLDRLTPFERVSRVPVTLEQTAVNNIQALVAKHEIRVIKPVDLEKEVFMGVMHGMNVAIKKQAFRKVNGSFKDWSVREANILRMASEKSVYQHDRGFPHIVSFVNHFKFEMGNIHILVMEYCEFGTLLEFASNAKSIGIGSDVIFQFALDLALGVDFLHRIGIAHRDLKLENVFLTGDACRGRVILKIGDFGYSIMTSERSFNRESMGAPAYAAPENYITPLLVCPVQTDSWCFGVCMFSMFECRFPFHGSENEDIAHRERMANFGLLKEDLFAFPYHAMEKNPLFRDLVENLMIYEPLQRLAINQVLRSPFFNAMTPKSITPPQMAACLARIGDSCLE